MREAKAPTQISEQEREANKARAAALLAERLDGRTLEEEQERIQRGVDRTRLSADIQQGFAEGLAPYQVMGQGITDVLSFGTANLAPGFKESKEQAQALVPLNLGEELGTATEVGAAFTPMGVGRAMANVGGKMLPKAASKMVPKNVAGVVPDALKRLGARTAEGAVEGGAEGFLRGTVGEGIDDIDLERGLRTARDQAVAGGVLSGGLSTVGDVVKATSRGGKQMASFISGKPLETLEYSATPEGLRAMQKAASGGREGFERLTDEGILQDVKRMQGEMVEGATRRAEDIIDESETGLRRLAEGREDLVTRGTGVTGRTQQKAGEDIQSAMEAAQARASDDIGKARGDIAQRGFMGARSTNRAPEKIKRLAEEANIDLEKGYTRKSGYLNTPVSKDDHKMMTEIYNDLQTSETADEVYNILSNLRNEQKLAPNNRIIYNSKLMNDLDKILKEDISERLAEVGGKEGNALRELWDSTNQRYYLTQEGLKEAREGLGASYGDVKDLTTKVSSMSMENLRGLENYAKQNDNAKLVLDEIRNSFGDSMVYSSTKGGELDPKKLMQQWSRLGPERQEFFLGKEGANKINRAIMDYASLPDDAQALRKLAKQEARDVMEMSKREFERKFGKLIGSDDAARTRIKNILEDREANISTLKQVKLVDELNEASGNPTNYTEQVVDFYHANLMRMKPDGKLPIAGDFSTGKSLMGPQAVGGVAQSIDNAIPLFGPLLRKTLEFGVGVVGQSPASARFIVRRMNNLVEPGNRLSAPLGDYPLDYRRGTVAPLRKLYESDQDEQERRQ